MIWNGVQISFENKVISMQKRPKYRFQFGNFEFKTKIRSGFRPVSDSPFGNLSPKAQNLLFYYVKLKFYEFLY